MKKIKSNVLPIIAVGVILSPLVASLLQKDEPPPPPPVVRAPDPEPVRKETDPAAWFAGIRARCTPAEVTLATDLNRPPPGVQGVGYEAACFALAGRVPKARAILLGLPEGDRVQAAAQVYDVGQRLAGEGRHEAAGPLMELVLEFWPNHYLALYEAGSARFTQGDHTAASDFLARFLDIYVGNDDLVANAQRMMADTADP
jgi:hypothetical protein